MFGGYASVHENFPYHISSNQCALEFVQQTEGFCLLYPQDQNDLPKNFELPNKCSMKYLHLGNDQIFLL